MENRISYLKQILRKILLAVSLVAGLLLIPTLELWKTMKAMLSQDRKKKL